MIPVVPLMPLHGWQWVTTLNGVIYLSFLGLPLTIAVIAALALRRRHRGASWASAWRSSFAEVGLVYGSVPWLVLTMQPGAEAGLVRGRVSLVPFVDLVSTGPSQIIGNLLVLAALGFCAPLRFRSLASLTRISALAAACSILIETAQYVLRLDRVSSIDDVLLNTAGAALAAIASRPFWQPPERCPRRGRAEVASRPKERAGRLR
jgi:hypothetical protein